MACRIVPPGERGATPGDPDLTLRRFAARCNGTSKTSGLEDKERQASHQVKGFRREEQDHARLRRNRHARRTAGSRPRGVDGQRPTPFLPQTHRSQRTAPPQVEAPDFGLDDRIDHRGAPPPCRRSVGVPRPTLLNLPRGPNRRTGRSGSCGVGFGAPPNSAHRAQGQECGGFPRCPDSARARPGAGPCALAMGGQRDSPRMTTGSRRRRTRPLPPSAAFHMARSEEGRSTVPRGYQGTEGVDAASMAASIRPLAAGRRRHGTRGGPRHRTVRRARRGTGPRDAHPARSVGGSAARPNGTLTFQTWDAPSPFTLAFRPDRKAGIVPE